MTIITMVDSTFVLNFKGSRKLPEHHNLTVFQYTVLSFFRYCLFFFFHKTAGFYFKIHDSGTC